MLLDLYSAILGVAFSDRRDTYRQSISCCAFIVYHSELTKTTRVASVDVYLVQAITEHRTERMLLKLDLVVELFSKSSYRLYTVDI
jgi:hypothetical protein